MKHLLCSSFFVLALLGLGLGAYYRPTKQNPPVNNNLQAVAVVSLSESADAFELFLMNMSNKRINGYCISFNNGSARTVDMSVGERTIGPGEQFKVSLPHRNEILPLSIRYILFDDGTGVGDADGIGELQDRRAGRVEQLKRIVPLLNRASAAPDVGRLKTDLEALPEERKADRSIFFLQGQRDAKEDALLALEKLDKTTPGVGISKLAQQTGKMLDRLRFKQ